SVFCFFFFSSRRRHTRCLSDWSSDVCSSDLYLRVRRIPYVAVDEARKTLLPRGPVATVRSPEEIGSAASLKSFDFVIYGQGANQIGRASCRERGWVEGGALSVK